MRFLISAGEASGEAYGAQLIAALRARMPTAEFFGVGGERMRAAGHDLIIDARQIAVVGLAEVVTHLPKIYGEFRRLLREVDRRRPDVAVLIDFPDFNFRLARELHRRGVPVFYYISPQLWAWRPGRVALVRRYVRKMLVIFPFEAEWYRQHGVDAEYVGHPLADLPAPALSRQNFGAEYGLDSTREWIALLPGSRRKELLMNLPGIVEAAAVLGSSFHYVLPVASTLDRRWVEQQVRRSCSAVARTQAPPRITLTTDSRTTLAHARAAAVASGTATVEAALMDTPFVMVYRVAPLTWMLGRRLVSVPHYGMVNLIAGRQIVPELVQQAFTGGNLAAELQRIIPDGTPREAMLAGLAEVRRKLSWAGKEGCAADRAAGAIVETIG